MEEIKVGEFIRTDNGEIFKVLDVEKGSVKIKSDYREWIGICTIKIHSFNIIDLIEVGDYVNGYRVLDIMENMQTGTIHLEMTLDYNNPEIGDCTIYNKDIKSIVTKEQFEHEKYIVGG